jgi:hypothetical protein
MQNIFIISFRWDVFLQISWQFLKNPLKFLFFICFNQIFRHLVEVGMTLYECRFLKDVHWLKKTFLLLDNDLKKQKWIFYHLVDNPKNKWFFWGPFYLKVLISFFVGWRQLIVCYTLLKGWDLEKIDSRITCETALEANL